MTTYMKYPRTPHLPWSPGATSDDIWAGFLDHFLGQEVVVTEKMDGENTSLYSDHLHARSPDSRHHPSRDWIKGFHASMRHDIPKGWRVCGENLYAKHSLGYENLPSFFLMFSIWNEQNICLDWESTLEWAELIGVKVVPVLYQGIFDEDTLRSIQVDESTSEGYVVRLASSFRYENFRSSIAKWVRPGHVQTDAHWMHQEVRPNSEGSCE
jgi:hypothetical protein